MIKSFSLHIQRISKHYSVQVLIIFGIFTILLLPLLFETYRTNAFDTVPRDPYEPYLLYLAGEEQGFLPGSPFAYRILSIVPALVPFKLIDAPVLSQIESPNQIWLNAVFANAVISYLSVVSLSSIMYLIVRDRMGCSMMTAISSALAVPILHGFTGVYLTDPFVILYLFVTFAALKRFWIWIPMIIVGVGVNEKIPLIFAIYSLLTLIHLRNKKTYLTFACSFAACIIYVLIRHMLNFPGYENQTDVTTFLAGFWNSFEMSLSAKGIMRNFIPIMIMLVIAGTAVLAKEKNQEHPILPSHVFLVVALAFVSFATDVQMNVGRNVMHLFPLFLPQFFRWCEESITQTRGRKL
ncbi:MAG: hypothetical protein MI748_03865 [Opitutales bacterium]|nr:hypothetical protein [Opitutales bacterium]